MMKRIFTSNFLLALMTFLGIGILSQLNAQVVLTITSPESLAGSYEVARMQFGPQDVLDVEGPLTIASPNLACDPITNDLTGQIGVVDRGTCPFVDKVRNAQDAGAIAVLICQNINEPPFSGAGEAEDVVIPAFMAGLLDCNAFKAAINAGEVRGVFERPPCRATIPPNTVWGDLPGQGDFDPDAGAFGPDGWIIANNNENEVGWEWDLNASYRRGAFSGGGLGFLNSATLCNGAMVFDSDFWDNGGNSGNQGGHLCPGPCEGSLVSPRIDLSGEDIQGLFVQFTQGLRQFTSQYFLLVSLDDGITWSDTFRLNASVPINSPHIQETIRVPLCGVPLDDLSRMRIRFSYVGNYYYWIIDDVFIINEGDSDPVVMNNWYAVAPNYKTPAGQGESIPLMTDIGNEGNIPAENVNVDFNVFDSSGERIYNQSLGFGNVDGCSLIENEIFEEFYPMPAEQGDYVMEYLISADNANDNTANDRRRAGMRITEKTFGKVASEADFGTTYLSSIVSGVNWAFVGGGNHYTSGTVYYVPNGAGFRASKVRFGLATGGSAMFIGSATVNLYNYYGDTNGNGMIDGSERELIGSQTIIIDEEFENRRNIEVSLAPDGTSFGDAVLLEDDQMYLAAVHWSSTIPANTNAPMLSVNLFSNNPEIRQFYTQPVRWAMAQRGIERRATMTAWGNSDTDIEERALAPLDHRALYLELDIEPVESNTKDIKDHFLKLNLYPNPSRDRLILELSLGAVSNNVWVDISTLEGKKFVTKQLKNVESESIEFNTSNLTSGMYFMSIRTDAGVTTRRFIVQRN
jgi:hypothetical protein